MTMDTLTAIAQPSALPLIPTHFYRHKRRLRALLIEGQPWFVVRDLSKLMNAFLQDRLARNLDPDQLRRAMLRNDNGLAEEVELLSESAVYAVLIHFHHPENRGIRQWISNSVVPSLRDAAAPALGEVPQRRLLRWEQQQLSVLDWQGQVWVPLPELAQTMRLG
ncbi:BRO family protein [Pseudomonas citronellolis]|uniref:BRO family protein n=1 Tax=Pseudomonas citronellolis TaxID=53408 RepID=A0AAW6NZF4_9PSED|nr:BRO family protein [Pseudomonas citronellolis]MDF3840347.1 BRO family protein [Pseudomonas citronellolis]